MNIRIPLGLKIAPATFQRAVDVILVCVRWKSALVYFEDISLFYKFLAHHIKHVRHVLCLFYDAGFSLKLKKCRFSTESTDYQGLVIFPGSLEFAEHTNVAMASRKHPAT